jgi:oligogalacturonide lyase
MNLSTIGILTLACASLAGPAAKGQGSNAPAEPPTEWIDADTGHRVIRLSREPGSQSLYFHQNPYTAEGDKLVITTSNGISTIDLKTRAIDQVITGQTKGLVVGKKTRQAFFYKDDTVYAADLDTHALREIARTPPDFRYGAGLTVNADETVLAGSFAKYNGQRPPQSVPDEPGLPGNRNLEQRWANRAPMSLYTIQIKTGEIKTFHDSTNWLNHVQFSPSDPALLMFCHEGPWDRVDRTWTIRTDGSAETKIHTRTMVNEIEGHEFFSADGKIIWYDLQTPKSQVFWLGGYEIATGQQIWYHLERSEWSVHFNVSQDGKLFAGDGGGSRSVASPGNGTWIYLFHPQLSSGAEAPGQKGLDPHRHFALGTPGQPGPARLHPGAERQLHSRRKMDRFPFQHVWPVPRLRRRNRQGPMILTSMVHSA